MLLTALAMPILAAAAAPGEPPINVVGHAWAPFISPMGEPFRPRTATDDTLADWFALADRNHDGFVTVDEMQADADRFFAKLDTDGNGEIDPDELAAYEYDIAPDIQVMSRTRRAAGQKPPEATRGRHVDTQDSEEGPSLRRQRERGLELDASLGIGGALQGAARYSLLNIPEPVAAADADFNRAITREEFKEAAIARFQLLDGAHQGRLTLAQLQLLRPVLPADRRKVRRNPDAPDNRIGNPLPPGGG